MTLTETLAQLAGMPGFLEGIAARFTAESARRRPPDGSFSFVENVWHLADLEREGYGRRIARLRDEEGPALPDFDGARVARERDYQARSVPDGLAAFASARRANLAVLATLAASEWDRTGVQEGVGAVRLRDVPAMMLEHDAGHRDEVRGLIGEAGHGPGADASR
jgi:DinB family protein